MAETRVDISIEATVREALVRQSQKEKARPEYPFKLNRPVAEVDPSEFFGLESLPTLKKVLGELAKKELEEGTPQELRVPRNFDMQHELAYLRPDAWRWSPKFKKDGRTLHYRIAHVGQVGWIKGELEDVTPKPEQVKLPRLGRPKGKRHLLNIPKETTQEV